MRFPLLVILPLAVSGSASRPVSQTAVADPAHAILKNAAGETVATVALEQTPHGVLLHVRSGAAMPAGTHALHIHSVGQCTPPQFTSAGGHFNPAGKKHGFLSEAGMHAGDLPNLTIPAGTEVRVDLFAPGLELTGGSGPILDSDGAALVVHATADDYTSDPAGNAGGRIACGVITKGALPASR